MGTGQTDTAMTDTAMTDTAMTDTAMTDTAMTDTATIRGGPSTEGSESCAEMAAGHADPVAWQQSLR